MQKLKYTCDMCSISKVRCDKNKTVCGRCKRLQYSCNYSPARSNSKRESPQSIDKSQKCLEREGFQASAPSITSSIPSAAFSHPTFERDAETVSSQLMPPEIIFSDVTEHDSSLAYQADFVSGTYDTCTNLSLIPDESSMTQAYNDGHARTGNQSHIQQLYRQYLPGPSRDISEYYHNTGEVSATLGQEQAMSSATFDTQFMDHIISDHDYATMATTCAHSELYQQQQQS